MYGRERKISAGQEESKIKTKLRIKIILLFGVTIFFIISIYFLVFSYNYRRYEEKVLGEESINTLHSLENSIHTVIDSVNDYSKILLSDEVIQKTMESGNLFDNISQQSEIIRKIYSIMQFSNSIDGVWLVDNREQRLFVGSSADIQLESEKGIDDDMYQKLQDGNRGYHLVVREQNGQRRISLVRSYNALKDFRNLGFIGVDLKSDTLGNLVQSIRHEGSEEIIVLDQENNILYRDGTRKIKNTRLVEIAEKTANAHTKVMLENAHTKDGSYLLTSVSSSKNGWTIIRSLPIQESKNARDIIQLNVILIFLSGILILGGAVGISMMLTTPVQRLLNCMKGIERGEFLRIEENAFLEEFKILFKGYNRMVTKIEMLIRQTIEKQKRIRQVEMNEIQEQMKPHFLYNTLDSIEALALMGETDKVCELVESLGDFYRKSVSGGREMLALWEEFKMTEDYANIMGIRFGDTFWFDIFLQEDCREYRIPKLTVQPLVENAFQHGIRAKNRFGEIQVRGYETEGWLHILVQDNGGGISDQTVTELGGEKHTKHGKSLGLRGTIERLRLMYGEGFQYKIGNQSGTKIHLMIAREALMEEKDGLSESNINR